MVLELTMANLVCTSLVLFQIWNNFYEKLKGTSFCSFKHTVTKPFLSAYNV